LRARDQSLAAWVERKPGVNLLEDQSLEVLSELAICRDPGAAKKAR
jgi:hypothetical protein